MKEAHWKIIIIILALSLLLDTTVGIRGGRVGGGRGGFKSNKKPKNRTRTTKPTSKERGDEIFENLFLEMTSENWTETENRTWIYVSALIDMHEAYDSGNGLFDSFFSSALCKLLIFLSGFELFFN